MSSCNLLNSLFLEPGLSLFTDCFILNRLYPSSPRSRAETDSRSDFQSRFIEPHSGHCEQFCDPQAFGLNSRFILLRTLCHHSFNFTLSQIEGCVWLFGWKVTVPPVSPRAEIFKPTRSFYFLFCWLRCEVSGIHIPKMYLTRKLIARKNVEKN